MLSLLNLEKVVRNPDATILYVSFGTNPVFEGIRKNSDSLGPVKMDPLYPGMITNKDHYAFTMKGITPHNHGHRKPDRRPHLPGPCGPVVL